MTQHKGYLHEYIAPPIMSCSRRHLWRPAAHRCNQVGSSMYRGTNFCRTTVPIFDREGLADEPDSISVCRFLSGESFASSDTSATLLSLRMAATQCVREERREIRHHTSAGATVHKRGASIHRLINSLRRCSHTRGRMYSSIRMQTSTGFDVLAPRPGVLGGEGGKERGGCAPQVQRPQGEQRREGAQCLQLVAMQVQVG